MTIISKLLLVLYGCFGVFFNPTLANSPPPPAPPTLEQHVNWATHIFVAQSTRVVYVVRNSSNGKKTNIGVEFNADEGGRSPILVARIASIIKQPCEPDMQGEIFIDAKSAGTRNFKQVTTISSTPRIFFLKKIGNLVEDPATDGKRSYFHFVAPPSGDGDVPQVKTILAQSANSNSQTCKK